MQGGGEIVKILFNSVVCVVVFALCGCASQQASPQSPPQVHQKSQAEVNLELANSGKILWSEYYKWMLNVLHRLPSDKYRNASIPLFSQLLTASQSYEAGQLSRDDFFAFQRKIKQQFIDDVTFDPFKPLPRNEQ